MCAAATDAMASAATQTHAQSTHADMLTRTQSRPPLRGLYAVTPDLADTRELVARVLAAIDGGAVAIQYRNKTATNAQRLEQATALADACRGRALYIVNDDPVLAASVGADGVHVGEHDGGIAAARSIVGEGAIIGVSCYDDLALARTCAVECADYIAFGSFFPSRSKPSARRAAMSLLRDAQSLHVPLVAIGGITAGNAASLFAAGASAVAVIADVFDHDRLSDITQAARRLAELSRDAAAPTAIKASA
jgi:thiamine-phosphate pyrophosphorylase